MSRTLALLALLFTACLPSDATQSGETGPGKCASGDCPASIECRYTTFVCRSDRLEIRHHFDEGALDPTPDNSTFYETTLVDPASGKTLPLRADGREGEMISSEAFVDGLVVSDVVDVEVSMSPGFGDTVSLYVSRETIAEIFGDIRPETLVINDITNGYRNDDGQWINHKKADLSTLCRSSG